LCIDQYENQNRKNVLDYNNITIKDGTLYEMYL